MSNYLSIDEDKEVTDINGTEAHVVFKRDNGKVICTVTDFGNGVRVCDQTSKPITLNYSQLAHLVEAFFVMKSEGNNTHGCTIYKVKKDLIKEI